MKHVNNLSTFELKYHFFKILNEKNRCNKSEYIPMEKGSREISQKVKGEASKGGEEGVAW